MTGTTWRNWAGTARCNPMHVCAPTTEEEISDLLRASAARDETVRCVGSGHSFTPIATTDDWLVRLDRMRAVVAVDRARMTVTAQAGITLAELAETLLPLGLALPILGDASYQTLAGAISTGTHGTGRAFGSLSTFVTGLRLVKADGAAIDCSVEHEPELLAAARVGLGALGIITAITLQCSAAVPMHAVEMPMPLDVVLDRFEEYVASNDHFLFLWFPRTHWTMVKRYNRTGAPLARRGRATEFFQDVVLDNLCFAALCRLGRVSPPLVPWTLSWVLPRLRKQAFIDHGHRVLARPRIARFYEMEYAIPRSETRRAVEGLRTLVERARWPIDFPVEVRCVAADDALLSPAYGRDVTYIAAHVSAGSPWHPYFSAFADLMRDYDGRPHWGKLHFQDHETLSHLYPGWNCFQAMRRRLDPRGRFTNDHLRRILGPLDDTCHRHAPSTHVEGGARRHWVREGWSPQAI